MRNNGSEPASLDPHKVESDVEFNIISDLFEGGWSVSPAGEIEPRLAAGKTKITPSDLPFTSGRYLAPTGPPPRRILSGACSVWSLSDGISLFQLPGQYAYCERAGNCRGEKAPETLGVKAVDDATLEVTLTQPKRRY